MTIKIGRFANKSYYMVTLLAFCIFCWIMWGKDFSVFLPWQYSGDAIFSAISVKSMIETGSFWQNSSLGFPNGFQLYDFPIDDSGNFLIIYLISLFTKNFAVVLNIYYFLTFLLTALTSVYVCKQLSLNKAFSLCVSLLFAFSSYHLLRGEAHLFLSAYYAIPIYLLLMFYVFSKDIVLTKTQLFFWILVVAFCASTGVYYAFFACFFLVITSIAGTLSQKSWTPILRGTLIIGLIGITVFANILPSFLYHMTYGNNLEVAQRLPLESEAYGLKIMALLLPPDFSGFSFLHTVGSNYFATSSVGTNVMPYLGMIGSIGFVFLLFVSLNTRWLKTIDEKIITLSTLSLSALLLATVGGFGAFFAYTISPEIRCYDRMSIFILYFSLLGGALFLQTFLSKSSKYNVYSWLIAVFLLMVGLYNQAGHYQKDYTTIKTQFSNDQHFIQKIETLYPKGAAIFQLPYWRFPENELPGFNLAPYECFRGYLNSSRLQWSTGATKGRTTATWQATVSAQPVPELLENIIFAGFSGLYIDRNGYEDHGKLIETQIESLTHTQPIISENNELVFFDLRSYAKTIFSQMSQQEITQKKAQIAHELAFTINWGEGFSVLDPTTKWSKQKSILFLVNNGKRVLHLTLSFVLITSTEAQVTIENKNLAKKLAFSADALGKKVTISLALPPGVNKIDFSTNAPRLAPVGDPRDIYFYVKDFSLSFEN